MNGLLKLLVPLLISSAMYGSVPILDKKTLEYFPNVEKYTVYRLLTHGLFSLLLILGYIIFLGLKTKDLKLKGGNLNGLKYMLLLAFINVFAIIFFVVSIKEADHTGLVSIVGMGITLMTTLLLSHYFLGQRLKPGMGISFSIIIIGIVMTLYFANK